MNQTAIQIPEDRIRQSYGAMETRIKGAARGAAAGPKMMSYGAVEVPGKNGEGSPLQQVLSEGGVAILDRVRHGVLVDVRRAGAIAMAVADMFGSSAGFDPLSEKNRSNAMNTAESERFHQIVAARAVVAGFVAAAYLTTRYDAPSGDQQASAEFKTDVVSPTAAIESLLSALSTSLEGRSDAEIGPAVWRTAAAAMKAYEAEAPIRMPRDLPGFESVSYAVETDAFHVSGFSHPSSKVRTGKVEIQYKTPREVVGNHVAKSQAMRLARMLACYDPARRSNPFVDLGGFLFSIMGDGFPGTGKTTLAQMLAGLTAGYCDFAGVPFHFEFFGIDQISEYQGKSGQNAKAFAERVTDPRTVAIGLVDDIDQIAGKRDDQRSSGGQQEVTAVLMEVLAGAGTIVRGNCSFTMFSNYPEKVDDALRQRAGARWLVDGPQTREDYVDILHLLIGNNHDIALGDHDLRAGQDIRKLASESYEASSRPQEPRLLEVFDRFVSKGGDLCTIAGLGAYLHSIREVEPRFTGRAVKNVTDAVKLRAMDFDLPDQWFEDRKVFFDRPYEERSSMIAALRRKITPEMVVQEVNRYADSEFRYSEKSDKASVDAIVREHRLRQKASVLMIEGTLA
jgi:hypothetical protein